MIWKIPNNPPVARKFCQNHNDIPKTAMTMFNAISCSPFHGCRCSATIGTEQGSRRRIPGARARARVAAKQPPAAGNISRPLWAQRTGHCAFHPPTSKKEFGSFIPRWPPMEEAGGGVREGKGRYFHHSLQVWELY